VAEGDGQGDEQAEADDGGHAHDVVGAVGPDRPDRLAAVGRPGRGRRLQEADAALDEREPHHTDADDDLVHPVADRDHHAEGDDHEHLQPAQQPGQAGVEVHRGRRRERGHEGHRAEQPRRAARHHRPAAAHDHGEGGDGEEHRGEVADRQRALVRRGGRDRHARADEHGHDQQARSARRAREESPQRRHGHGRRGGGRAPLLRCPRLLGYRCRRPHPAPSRGHVRAERRLVSACVFPRRAAPARRALLQRVRISTGHVKRPLGKWSASHSGYIRRRRDGRHRELFHCRRREKR
jgi:hypothetical protein